MDITDDVTMTTPPDTLAAVHRGAQLGPSLRLGTFDVPWLDVLAAAALLVLAILVTALQATAPVQAAGLVLAAAAPLARHRRPPLAAGLLLAGVLAVALGGPREIDCAEMLPAIALVMFAAGTQPSRAWALGLGAVGLAALAVEVVQDPALGASGLVFFGPIAIAVWCAGRAALVLRGRAEQLRERGRALEHQRAQTAALAVEMERDRVSGELRETIAGALDTIRATSADARRGEGELSQALSTIEGEGRVLLDDMRSVLGSLRRHGDGPMRAPQPSLRDIDRLLAQARTRGLEVSLQREGQVRAVADAPDRCAYRIIERAVQTAAGRVDVWLRWHERELELEIHSSDRSGWAELVAAAQERSRICGGRSTALAMSGPGAGVRATLPLAGIRA